MIKTVIQRAIFGQFVVRTKLSKTTSSFTLSGNTLQSVYGGNSRR